MKKCSILILLISSFLLLCACENGADDTQPYIPPGTPPANNGLPSSERTPDDTQPAPEGQDTQPSGSTGTIDDPSMPKTAAGEAVISFDYVRQPGAASNQWAVWIEDTDGNIVKSLYASRWTADGGYKTRPDSIFIWAGRAGLADMSKAEVDAVSGATPRTGALSYVWDLTDLNGDIISQGDYVFFVEGTLRWKNYVLYSGNITISDVPVSVQAEAVFHYEGTDRYDALTADSAENDMIGPVTLTYTPSN